MAGNAYMFAILLTVAIVWLGVLFAVLVIVIARSQSSLQRILAFDALSLVMIGMLALIAYSQDSVFYLDAALVLALLAFISTIAAVSYKRHGRFL